jgi:hypothetical protein
LRKQGLEAEGQFFGEKTGPASRLPRNGHAVDDAVLLVAGRPARLQLTVDESETAVKTGGCVHNSPVFQREMPPAAYCVSLGW